MRFAGELLQKLHGLGAAAIVGPVAQGRRIHHGRTVYKNIPELWRSAVDYTIDAGLPLTPANIRKSAEDIIAQTGSMIDDDLGILYDRLGHKIEDRETVLEAIRQSPRLSIADILKSDGFDPSLADDPNFPF